MALTITKLKMWKDPGYTRGCLEVPPAGSKKLPTADYESAADETLRPHKGSTLTALELPLSYTECFDMSYLYIEASDGKGSIALFGWITSITQIASSNEAIRIEWDCDWWRSYSGEVAFTRGIITKTANATYKRPLRTQPRRWELKYNRRMIKYTYSGSSVSGVFAFSYIVNGDIRYGITTSLFKDNGGNSYSGLTDDSIENLAYYIGVSSSSILGCWACPYVPMDYNTMYYDGAYLVFNVSSTVVKSHTIQNTNITRSWVESLTPQEMTELLTIYRSDLSNPDDYLTTDDGVKTVITDQYGTPYYTIPYGFKIRTIAVYIDMGPTEMYASLIFSETRYNNMSPVEYDNEKLNAIARGLFVTIPYPPISISSNALSDYYISGQREYDIETRRIQQEKELWQGISGVGGTAASGALTGSLAGAAGGPIGIAAGAIGGLGLGIGGVAINQWITGETNDALQRATDKLYSNQASQLITIGSTYGKTYAAYRGYGIVILEADSVSKDEIDAQIETQGYDVEIPTTDAASFIPSEGPIQIKNLLIRGDAPPAAKYFIKNKLEAGAYVIENNPSGVTP